MSLGLYLHIPFCSSICNYCNFNRGLFDSALKDRYVSALEREILGAADGSAADTIFFGGGTPSLLEPSEIGRLIAACRESFALVPDAEITLETNPETSTTERMEQFRAAGVNRVSFGVQSFREEELRRLGRLHSADRARGAVREARAAGFENVSLDLMMWLPQQTREQWQTTVEALIDVNPDHASLYLLELYPNAPLREDMARGGWSQAPDEDAAEMYLWSLARLDAAQYRQYEISNVARAGRESRHNLKYWQDGEWLGFGCGAHSTRGGVRWKNVSSTEEYIARLGPGAPAAGRLGLSLVAERRAMDPEARLEEALFTGLRLTAGLDLEACGGRYGVDIWAKYGTSLQPFVDEGLLVREGACLRLSREGMLIANEIMQVFV
ncbi:MAG TPA: radical SAM family heme chaperone HemW [Vicinamibacterales bacterium]|nr:radical SAM family heme chaperone HemW [Vicinamibacterales bacterium]